MFLYPLYFLKCLGISSTTLENKRNCISFNVSQNFENFEKFHFSMLVQKVSRGVLCFRGGELSTFKPTKYVNLHVATHWKAVGNLCYVVRSLHLRTLRKFDQTLTVEIHMNYSLRHSLSITCKMQLEKLLNQERLRFSALKWKT